MRNKAAIDTDLVGINIESADKRRWVKCRDAKFRVSSNKFCVSSNKFRVSSKGDRYLSLTRWQEA
ncbi:MAG: hypothetical protein ACRC2R_12965 [Xenococcaceae cyanobacterium]